MALKRLKSFLIFSALAFVPAAAGCLAGNGQVGGVPDAGPLDVPFSAAANRTDVPAAGPGNPPPGDVVSDTPLPVGTPLGAKLGDPHPCSGSLVFESGPSLTLVGSENGIQKISIEGALARRVPKPGGSDFGEIPLDPGTAVTALLDFAPEAAPASVSSVPADSLHFSVTVSLPSAPAAGTCLRLTVYRDDCSEYPGNPDGPTYYFGPAPVSAACLPSLIDRNADLKGKGSLE